MNKQTQEALKIENSDFNNCTKQELFEYIVVLREALEQPLTRDWKETIDERIARDNEFKEALEQPAQEPVEYLGALANVDGSVNLYFKKDQWQGLTDDEINKLNPFGYADEYELEFARDIEQALKDKNDH